MVMKKYFVTKTPKNMYTEDENQGFINTLLSVYNNWPFLSRSMLELELLQNTKLSNRFYGQN